MASTVRKLIVEVVEARNLLPKDDHGTSSPYVILDFHGQRKKTRTTARDLNPVWNELVEFNVGKTSDVFSDILEVDVFHDRVVGPTTRNNFLGRVRLESRLFGGKDGGSSDTPPSAEEAAAAEPIPAHAEDPPLDGGKPDEEPLPEPPVEAALPTENAKQDDIQLELDDHY